MIKEVQVLELGIKVSQSPHICTFGFCLPSKALMYHSFTRLSIRTKAVRRKEDEILLA